MQIQDKRDPQIARPFRSGEAKASTCCGFPVFGHSSMAGVSICVPGPMLAVFVALAVIGWGAFWHHRGCRPEASTLRRTCHLLIWGIWWPAMVWIAVLVAGPGGMVWSARAGEQPERSGSAGVSACVSGRCAVDRLGHHHHDPVRIDSVLVAGAEIPSRASYTSLFLIGLLARPRSADCFSGTAILPRLLPPSGCVLSAYGRWGMLARSHRDRRGLPGMYRRGCIRACNRMKADGRSLSESGSTRKAQR